MYCCSDCENFTCDDHTYFGYDSLERCARCHARRERADAGPPPPPGHLAQVEAAAVSWISSASTPRAWTSWRRPRALLGLWRRGLLPGDTLAERLDSATVTDSHGTGDNQCGSSFYGSAYGGGVYHQGAGVRVSQPNIVAGYPASVGSGTGPSLGYGIHGADRQGMAVVFLKLRGEMTDGTSAPSVVSESLDPVPLSSHALWNEGMRCLLSFACQAM